MFCKCFKMVWLSVPAARLFTENTYRIQWYTSYACPVQAAMECVINNPEAKYDLSRYAMCMT